jgi:hypothetical protein
MGDAMTDKESIAKASAKAFIASLEGRFFTVSYYSKSDGCVVTRNAMAKRFAELAGGVDKLADSPCVAYFDNNREGWRSFNVNNLVEIRCGDKVYKGEFQE